MQSTTTLFGSRGERNIEEFVSWLEDWVTTYHPRWILRVKNANFVILVGLLAKMMVAKCDAFVKMNGKAEIVCDTRPLSGDSCKQQY